MPPSHRGSNALGGIPPCCGKVARKRAASDAGGSSPARHEGLFPDTPPGLAYGASTRASNRLPHAAARSVLVCRWVLAFPVSGHKPVQPSCRDAESAMPPYGTWRPVRPWLVVNPGGGTAAPWASWPQPFSANNFPAAARLLAQQILCASRFSTLLRPLCGAARPSPAGRFTTRTHWRDLVQPERRKHHG